MSRATDLLSHRGPDDVGLFFDKDYGVGLGHRRLSIIDLSETGKQPMADGNEHVRIAYNGEIYNFKALRDQLYQRGHRFRGQSDTEVILEAYLEWGVGCFERLVGMFALAIWDCRHERLILARDGVGIKPLYYYHDGNTLLFASELKGLMAFPSFPRNVDEEALSLFLHYQYIPAPRTIFHRTHKLMPGTYLVCDGQGVRAERFWRVPQPCTNRDHGSLDEGAALDALDETLSAAVVDQMVSDVPLGALLSGGIDSSLVAALMQKVGKEPVRTFSIGFHEQGYDEAPWARRVADHLGTCHTELYVTPDEALALIPRLPDIYDEPFADSSAIPTSLVCRLTRSQVKVALSGDGGDEQYAGYVRYWMTQSGYELIGKLPNSFRVFLSKMMGVISPSWAERLYLPLRDHLPQRFQMANFADKWRKLCELLPHDQLVALYRATICVWPEEALSGLLGRPLPGGRFEEAFAETATLPPLSRMMWVDQQTYLPDAMLTKVDRASMASSLEVRVPLLDQRAMVFAATLPNSLKYRDGKGKYLLRKLLARYVPTRLFERPKMGFGVPIADWLRNELQPMVCDYLSSTRLRNEGRFDPTVVEKTIQDHLTGRHNHQHRIWALLMWQMWRERWLG